MCLFHYFPSKDTSILHARISTLEISRIWASISCMLTHIALHLQGKKHAMVIEHILPYKLLCLAGIRCESYIARQTGTCDINISDRKSVV